MSTRISYRLIYETMKTTGGELSEFSRPGDYFKMPTTYLPVRCKGRLWHTFPAVKFMMRRSVVWLQVADRLSAWFDSW